MSHAIHVEWTLLPTVAPQPKRSCNRCRAIKPFTSTGKFRLNANGKRLDAWLIYSCTICANTWNRPLFERANVRDMPPATLQALQSNDPCLADRFAFDLPALRLHSAEIQQCPDIHIHKRLIQSAAPPCQLLKITLNIPLRVSLRLDRLLSQQLGLSRARIHAMEATGCIKTEPAHHQAARRGVKDKAGIILCLANEEDRDAISHSALP